MHSLMRQMKKKNVNKQQRQRNVHHANIVKEIKDATEKAQAFMCLWILGISLGSLYLS